jgi:hypothetical protein
MVGESVAMSHDDYVAEDRGVDGGETGEDPRIIHVMVGEEVGFGIGLDERGAVFDGTAEHERVVVFAEANEKRAADLQRSGAVGDASSTPSRVCAICRTASNSHGEGRCSIEREARDFFLDFADFVARFDFGGM